MTSQISKVITLDADSLGKPAWVRLVRAYLKRWRLRFATSFGVGTILLAMALAPCPYVLADGKTNATANADQVTLEFVTAAGHEVQLTVPQQGGSLIINVIRKGPPKVPLTIDVLASPFYGEHGDVVNLKLGIANDAVRRDTPPPLSDVKVNEPVLPVRLLVPPLADSGKYSGKLFFATADRVLLTLDVVLTRATTAQPAMLVVVPQAGTLEVTKPLWWGTPPSLTVTIRDKSGQWKLQGVYAEIEQITKAPHGEFDPHRNVELLFNGKYMDGFARSRSAKASDRDASPELAAGEHATVQMQLLNLKAGQYNIVFRFLAKNSAFDDASQRFTLTANVRDSWALAGSTILGALLLSFFGIKLVDFRRKGLDLEQRIAAVGAGWLNAEPPVFPVVLARAILRQVIDLSDRWWLSSPDVLDACLTQVTKLVEVLGQVRRVRDGIMAAPLGPLVRTRAVAILGRIVANLNYDSLDDQTMTAAKTDIAKLSNWLPPNPPDAAYWAELCYWVDLLLGEVRPTAISDPDDSKWIDKLQRELREKLKTTPSNLSEMEQVESEYARLKILWERRQNLEEFHQLVSLDRLAQDHEALFKAADAAAWARLNRRRSDNQFKIVTPRTDDLEAYQPITFAVSTGDDALDATFLFQHGLRYEWTFTLLDTSDRQFLVLRPVSHEPRVVQYSPSAGTVTATVKVHWHGETLEGVSAKLCKIGASSDFTIWQGFETMEIVSLGVAILIGVGIGLRMYYFGNPTFGSMEDYLALATWGFGTDITKTGLQKLQESSSWKPQT